MKHSQPIDVIYTNVPHVWYEIWGNLYDEEDFDDGHKPEVFFTTFRVDMEMGTNWPIANEMTVASAKSVIRRDKVSIGII